jgi:hypothetical protein
MLLIQEDEKAVVISGVSVTKTSKPFPIRGTVGDGIIGGGCSQRSAWVRVVLPLTKGPVRWYQLRPVHAGENDLTAIIRSEGGQRILACEAVPGLEDGLEDDREDNPKED